MKHLCKSLGAAGMLLLSLGAQAANWEVDNAQSELSFISTKKVNVAEVHHFGHLSGKLSDAGEFSLAIDLASVNTGVDIRDSRMKEFLFDVADFPTADLNAKLDSAMLDSLAVGASKRTAVDGTLSLHDQSKALTFEVVISKLSDNQLLVVAAQPVIVNVADFDLVQGVEKLRDLAGLPSISQAVPVSFYLTLNAK